MKKSYLFSAFAAGMVMLSACSNDGDLTNGGNESNDAVQQFVLQVANTGDGLQTRAGRPLESSEATQTIENVKIIVCDKQTHDVKYVTTIKNWNENTVSSPYTDNGHGRKKTIMIPKEEKLAAGEYTVYAFGYSSSSEYDADDLKKITDVVKSTPKSQVTFTSNVKLGTKTSSIKGEEIFAGSQTFTVTDNIGFNQGVVLNRQVAGTFGYFDKIPYVKGATTLQLVAANRNKTLVLGNFNSFDLTGNGGGNGEHVNYVVNGTDAAADNEKVIYSISLDDWFKGVTDNNNDGLIDYDESNWKGDASKYALGSVFAGQFLIPFEKSATSAETFVLQLTNGTDVLKSWTVRLPEGDGQFTTHTLWKWNTDKFVEAPNSTDDYKVYNVVRNHLYGLGKRPSANPTTPGTDPDKPEPLNKKHELTLRVNDNWEVIHQMELE